MSPANNKSSALTPSGPVWRVAQWIIFFSLGRAANRILLYREMTFVDGGPTRWLRKDVRGFVQRLRPAVQDLRPSARLQELPRFGNRLLVELTVWTVAAYRILRADGVSASEARAVVADIGWVVYAQMVRLYSLPFRLFTRNVAKRLRWTVSALLRFPFSAPGAPGYQVKVSLTDDGILTHFTHCPPQSFVRRLADEAGHNEDLLAFQQSWCRYDWPGADIVAGDGARNHYVRPHTLSHGDSVCDMCWRAGPALHASTALKMNGH